MDHDTTPADTPDAPLVPGLVLGRPLGRGAHGSVWQARDAVTGDLVAVKVGRRPDDARTAREAALLARVDHPHVVRLRNVVECPDGTRALVLDLAEGGSLRDLVGARGRLPAGETVTVAVGLARTLADLHALGLVHGDLTPGNVLLTADGRPLVADLGVSGVLGADAGDVWGTPGFADPAGGPATDPARDVHSLGALVRFCLTGAPDGAGPQPAGAGADALLALADLATDPDPGRRPDAAEVARLAWAAASPEPLRLDVTAPPGRGPDRRRGPLTPTAAGDVRAQRDAVAAALLGRDADPPSAGDVTRRIRQSARAETDRKQAAVRAAAERRRARVRRAVRTGGVLAGAVVGGSAVAVGATTWLVDAPARPRGDGAPQRTPLPSGAARTSLPTSPPTSLPARQVPSRVAPADVARAVERLAAARARALRAGTVAALSAVDEPGSPAHAQDEALLGRLGQAGVRLDGLRFGVTGVRVVGRDGATVTVEARVTTSAHRQVRADGVVVRRVPAGAARTVRLVLVGTASGWRVRSVGAA